MIDDVDDAIETTLHNNLSSIENAVHEDTLIETNDTNQANEISHEQLQQENDENDLEVEEYNQIETPSTDVDNSKSSFTPVRMDSDESVAIGDIFNATENVVSNEANNANADVSPSLENVVLSANETARINSKGQIVVKRIVDDDLECVYIYGERPVPLAPFYHIKLNDLVTGNIPFKENVSCKMYASSFYI